MDEYQLKLLKELSENANLSQRDLSRRLGLSLGKVNYVLNALLKKGLIKTMRFKNSKNKSAYMYILTPKGMRGIVDLTYEFLKVKINEYDLLKKEIEELRKDIDIIENGRDGDGHKQKFDKFNSVDRDIEVR